MTISGATARAGNELEGLVSKYLREHPDFFSKHTELLKELLIPHPSGEAVSLVQRQLAALRDENARLKQQLSRVIEVAKTNEALNERIHTLAIELMGASGPQAIFAMLRDRLRTGLRADAVAVRVFAEPAFIDSEHPGEFVGVKSVRRGPFAPMLDAAKPLCGRLTKMQSAALFDLDKPSGSAVVLPLRGKRWDGLLGILSHDASRFDPSQGTELLSHLAAVASLVINPWVTPRKKG
jgi:hypothetical protein